MTDIDFEARRRARRRRRGVATGLGWVWTLAALPVTFLLGGLGALIGLVAHGFALPMLVAAIVAVVLHFVVKNRLEYENAAGVALFFVTILVVVSAVLIVIGGLAADASHTTFGVG